MNELTVALLALTLTVGSLARVDTVARAIAKTRGIGMVTTAPKSGRPGRDTSSSAQNVFIKPFDPFRDSRLSRRRKEPITFDHFAHTGSVLYRDSDGTVVINGPLTENNLQAVISSFGAATRSLRIESAQSLSSDLKIPSNVTVTLGSTGSINYGTHNLTINGPFQAPLRQVLVGTGTLRFGGNAAAEYFPQWTGASPTASGSVNRLAAQTMLDAMPAGGKVRLTEMFPISGTGPQLLLISKRLYLEGNGLTGFIVDSGVPASTDVIRVSIVGEGRFVTIKDLTIIPASGRPSRYGIHLDISAPRQRLADLLITGCYIEQLGSQAIHLSNPLPNRDGFFVSQIERNFLVGGISLQNAGDSISIIDNTIAGAGLGIDLSTVPGAMMTVIERNNLTSAGGQVRISSGDQLRIEKNNIEQVSTYTGSSNAMVELAGSSGAHLVNTIVRGNTINPLGRVANLIKIDYAEDAVIEDNNLQKGTGTGIVITANALDTKVRPNRWGTAEIAPSIDDNGVGTRNVDKSLAVVAAGWANNGVPIKNAVSRKDSEGWVQLQGLIVATRTPSLPVSLFTLPVGHRPSAPIHLPVLVSTAAGPVVMGRIQITTGGVVVLETGPTATNDSVSLEGIRFFAAEP
jgi:Right handed beta helix region